MKPYLSIVMPTMRIGGLDVVFNSLEQQDFKDFELILCDNLYKYRKDIVAEKAKAFSFRYKHVEPFNNRFPTHACGHTTNSATVCSSGEVIIFSTDYRWFPSGHLQRHADFHKISPEIYGYAPPSISVMPPSMKPGLPDYGNNENYDQYVKDLESGKLTEFMWSIFADDPFSFPQDVFNWTEKDRSIYGHDPKDIYPPGAEVNPMHIILQSESVKTKIVLAANGSNEALDGAHSHQDIEFSHRLRNMFGFRFIGDNSNPVYRVTGGHSIVNKIKLVEPQNTEAVKIFEKYRDGSVEPVNDWNMQGVYNSRHMRDFIKK